MAKTKKQKPAQKQKVVNRRAHYDYNLSDKLEVGMVLTGPQVRLIRDHHAQLKGTYVTLRKGELWLLGLTLGTETEQNIKLLATKKQIAGLDRAKQDGRTIVPVELLPTKRHIKLRRLGIFHLPANGVFFLFVFHIRPPVLITVWPDLAKKSCLQKTGRIFNIYR